MGVALGPSAPKGRGGQRDRYILADTTRPDRLYIKHSTAGHTAWEAPDWSPRWYLPTWPGGIRPSLCQDIYFPLLAASRHSGREVRVIVNAAGADLGLKRRRLLVATAIENQCPIVSTWQNTGKEVPCAVDALGGRLPLHVVDPRAKSKLFVVDLDDTGVPEVFKDIRDTGAGDSTKIRFKHGVPQSPGTDVTVVRLDSRALRDPRRWVRPELQGGTCMFHLQVPVPRADEARRIAEARATQLGTPTVLEYGNARLVIERATKRKDVRVNDDAWPS